MNETEGRTLVADANQTKSLDRWNELERDELFCAQRPTQNDAWLAGPAQQRYKKQGLRWGQRQKWPTQEKQGFFRVYLLLTCGTPKNTLKRYSLLEYVIITSIINGPKRWRRATLAECGIMQSLSRGSAASWEKAEGNKVNTPNGNCNEILSMKCNLHNNHYYSDTLESNTIELPPQAGV